VAARLLVAARPAILGVCQLCMVGPQRLAEAVLIEHTEGAAVALAACERCARAARRIAAAIGPRDVTLVAGAAPGARRRTATPRGRRPVRAEPELIREFADRIADGDGSRYVVQVYGQAGRDGMWVGWIAFVTPDAATALRTEAETSQPDRAALAYWADGLEPIYLEGAFARARRRGASPRSRPDPVG